MKQLEKTCNNTIENVSKKTRSLIAPSKIMQLQNRKTHVYPHLDLDQNKQATTKEKSLQQDQLIVGTYRYNCRNIQKNALE